MNNPKNLFSLSHSLSVCSTMNNDPKNLFSLSLSLIFFKLDHPNAAVAGIGGLTRKISRS
jgi:hypothetical protein